MSKFADLALGPGYLKCCPQLVRNADAQAPTPAEPESAHFHKIPE